MIPADNLLPLVPFKKYFRDGFTPNFNYMQDRQALENVLDTREKKLAFFQNLILLAAADGQLDEKESSFLLNIGNKLGISPEEGIRIAENLPRLTFVIPEEGLQKTLELQTLVMMMTEDGQIHNREYTLCRLYARRIGYSEELLEDLIKQFDGHAPSGQ